MAATLPWLTGEDPARSVLRAREPERPPDPAVLEALRAELDLAANPVAGTLSWLSGAVRGDLGVSWVSGEPVTAAVTSGLGVSLTLSGLASLLALLVASTLVAPALVRAARGRRPTSQTGTAVSAVLMSIPEVVLAVVLVGVVAVSWGWFPTSGWRSPSHLVLPVLALGLPAAGLLARVLSGAVQTTAGEAWISTWRAAGVRPRILILQIARRALAIGLPQVLLLFVGTLGAATVIEATFAIPGLGSTALAAALNQDLPVVQGTLAVLVLLGLTVGGGGIVLHRLLVGPGLRGQILEHTQGAGRAGSSRGALTVGGLLLVVIVAGLLRDPQAIDTGQRLAPPSLDLPLGADPLGRDVLARLGHGALLTIGLALLVSVIVLLIGLAAGLRTTTARVGIADVLNAVPAIVMGIVVASLSGPGLVSAMIAVGLVGWIPLAVHTRTLAAEARASGFHQAALVAGAGRTRILLRHLLPVVAPPVARHALSRVPHNALALASLSFLGIGAAHDSPEWGKSFAETVGYLDRAPWATLSPALGLVMLGLTASLTRPMR